MLSFNYAIRQTKAAVAGLEYLIVPGGHFFRLITVQDSDGNDRLALTKMTGAPYPTPAQGGDPFIDGQGRISYTAYIGEGQAQTVAARRIRKRIGSPDFDQGLGMYQGFAGENVSVAVEDLGIQPSTGYLRQTFTFSTPSGFSYTTPNTADWFYDQQHNPGPNGQDLRSEYLRVVQDWYFPNMAYPLGACASADLAVLLKPEATAISKEPDGRDPQGRPWLGWTLDALGTMRRIPDLPEATVYAMAKNAGMRPPDEDLITSSGFGWSWQIMKPLAPAERGVINSMGVIQYSESYYRTPSMTERIGFMNAFEYDAPAVSLDGMVVNWYADPNVWYRERLPVMITEVRSVLMSCLFGVNRFGIAAQPVVTGRASSRSVKIDYTATGNTGGGVSYVMMMRNDGSGVIDTFIQSSGFSGGGETENDLYRIHRYYGLPAYGHRTQYYVTPNGWQVPVLIPTIDDPNGTVPSRTYDPTYLYVLRFPNAVQFGSSPPAKPSDAPDDWVPPPFDLNIPVWRGRLVRDSSGNAVYANDTGQTLTSTSGQILPTNTFPPSSPNYIADGAYQWYGQGTIVMAQSFDGNNQSFFGAHSAKGVVPPVLGPGGSYVAYAEVDAFNPAVRYFPYPGTSIAILKLQHSNGWQVTFGGDPVNAGFDLGSAYGVQVVKANLTVPKPTSPS